MNGVALKEKTLSLIDKNYNNYCKNDWVKGLIDIKAETVEFHVHGPVG